MTRLPAFRTRSASMPATRSRVTAAKRTASTSTAERPKDTEKDTGTLPSLKLDCKAYPARRTEQGVFTTPPYSTYIKQYWRFKDEESAQESGQKMWEIFEQYRQLRDFVGMDLARKFIQMGRTRSLRYALRPGGRKYEHPSSDHDDHRDLTDGDDAESHRKAGRKEMKRTGEVYDEGKLRGAAVFEGYERRCWQDEVYLDMWKDWGGSKIVLGEPKVKVPVSGVKHEGTQSSDEAEEAVER